MVQLGRSVTSAKEYPARCGGVDRLFAGRRMPFSRMTAHVRSNTFRGGTRGAAPKMSNNANKTLAAYSSHDLSWKVGVVLIIDVVVFVRLMLDNQGRFITKWVYLRDQIEKEVVAAAAGRVVKSLGDGMLIEFKDVRSAVTASFAIIELVQVAGAQTCLMKCR